MVAPARTQIPGRYVSWVLLRAAESPAGSPQWVSVLNRQRSSVMSTLWEPQMTLKAS